MTVGHNNEILKNLNLNKKGLETNFTGLKDFFSSILWVVNTKMQKYIENIVLHIFSLLYTAINVDAKDWW